MLITDKNILKSYTSTKCRWIGIPSIEVTKKGRTFLTFYSGGVKEELGNYVMLVKSDDGINYGEPIAVCFAEGYRCFDPCLWTDPKGRLWLTWARCPDDGVFGAICDDPDADEIVFGEEFFIGNNIMMNKPTVLSTGEWLFPIAVWNDGIRVLPASYDSNIRPRGSYAYASYDEGKTFKRLGYADVKQRSFDEHQFLELDDGVVRVFVRTTYGIGAADSYDGGEHWGKDFDTGLGGPCSRFYIGRLRAGRVLLINHYKFSGRNNLTALLSDDGGKTFPYHLLLDERNDVSYPDVAVDADGYIYVTYDRERGAFKSSLKELNACAREILVARISEDDIVAGKLVCPDSYLKRVAFKLIEYDGDNVNPYNEKELFSNSDYASFLEGSIKDPDEIIAKIFDTYGINCANIHNVESQVLDALIERYKERRELAVLDEIVSTVRRAHSHSEYAEGDIVDRICRYIVENLESNDSSADIAEKFHFSTHYIRHIFKRGTGMSIKEFRVAQKIKKAKLLLKTTDNKIIDIAAACGFENPSYFTEIFSRITGISPTDYRKGVAGENE